MPSGRRLIRPPRRSFEFTHIHGGSGCGARAFTSIEENHDLIDGMISRVFTFDLDCRKRLAAWAKSQEGEAKPRAEAIVVGDYSVTIGGIKVKRRRQAEQG